MDAPDADPADLRKSLAFIRRVNRLLGYTRATLHHLERFSHSWKPAEPISVVDLATGSADIPRAMLDWADRQQINLHVIGVDLHADTLATARQQGQHPRLRFVRSDVRTLPFEDGSFDYAVTAMFLHHLSDDDVVRVMSEMNRVARRGVIVADLLRHKRAYAWITVLTAFAGPMVRHDARVSVAQAFTRAEAIALRDRAGLNYATYHRHFGHRFILAGERKK
jgi:ubiquinone/menaquinone biosynthesis C-methylase UbiE